MNTTILAMAEKFLLEDEGSGLSHVHVEAFDSHDAPIAVVRANGTLAHLNRAALAMTHAKAPQDLVGKPVGDAGLPWHQANNPLAHRLSQGESTLFFEVEDRAYVCETAALHNRLNETIGFLEYVRPANNWMLSYGIDPFTSISEKQRFFAETRRLLDTHPHERYAMVYWSVVRFRLIVDVFSPATGENVLKNIASTIKAFVGDDGTCGRVGDSSFAFCLPYSRLSTDWFKLRSEVTLVSDTAMYTFKSTFGVYEPNDLSCPVETMCERAAYAQASLGDAASADGACFAVYDEAMHQSVLEEQVLVSQLSYALASDQICVYYQPIYHIATNRLTCAEALARWERPHDNIVFPGRFIPLFESNGMITELDKYVWNRVAAFLSERVSAGKQVVPVSTNVSRVDFFATTLMDEFDDIVSSNHLPCELLRIEVTESAYTDDPGRIIDIVGVLRSRGHKVLLDDFGSGYSSLNTLKDMPIDILKLDMSFLRGFESNDRNKPVIAHVVAMAHDLGLKVVAEGVETQEQLNFLGSVNCDFAQGYYFSRPVPEREFVALLDKASLAESPDGANAAARE